MKDQQKRNSHVRRRIGALIKKDFLNISGFQKKYTNRESVWICYVEKWSLSFPVRLMGKLVSVTEMGPQWEKSNKNPITGS